MNLERILELYESLEAFLKKYGDDSILQSYKIVKKQLIFLNQKKIEVKKKNK